MSSNDIKSMMDIVSGDFSQEELHEGNAEVAGVKRREFLKTAVGTSAVAALAGCEPPGSEIAGTAIWRPS